MAALADRIDEELRLKLSPIGFEPVRARRWVSGTIAPIHKIFEFQAMKGGWYSARWGFSLDFVPVVRNGRLRRKRTSKSVEFDLCIDPIDEIGIAPDWCSFVEIATLKEVDASHLIRVVRAATRAAHDDFARVNSVGDVVTVFHERASMAFRRFSLENYVQTHIAWGLCLLAVGKRAEGEEHIRLFCEKNGINRNDPLIHKAESELARDDAMSSC
jgi:hypothetical protein